MSWRQLVIELGDLDVEAVEALLFELGAEAVTLTDAADDPILEPLPGATPLWAHTCLTALFPASASPAETIPHIVERLGLDAAPNWRVDTLEDRAWEREWLKDFSPMRFGERLWVYPVEADVPEDASVVLRLDPGMAFGTGTHATTALCLEALESLLAPDATSEKRVLDFGCGSGILAIAAALLGAKDVRAVDIDPQAVTATRRNATTNAVADRICVTLADVDAGADYDVVVANILANPLIELADALTGRLRAGGSLVLSGLLNAQAAPVAAAYAGRVDFEAPTSKDGWACLRGTRR